MAKGNQIIQMYTLTAGDAAASIDMPDDGVLLGLHWSGIIGGLAADEDYMRAQLSFGSTGAFTTNDARQVISTVSWGVDLIGAGSNLVRTDVNVAIEFGDGIPVFGGERVYIHTLANGNAALKRLNCMLLFNFKSGSLSRR